MKPSTRLDSAVFQLTPTRTRCDLVITANGKSEKLASGLLNPFLAHLKAAQDQITKGGYSITLEPDPRTDAVWFTKGIVERFVRFVSTPEVLERVSTIESEIFQIEEAIVIQGNDNLGISTVADQQARTTGSTEGSKSTFDADAEKAIVLYKPGSHPPDSNGSATQEENSKVQLLRVLETRKTVLQKEQGMAFARAMAAGFDMDHMTHLISFAESFGALRLKEACLRFTELWKRKHETGQWLEIEDTEVMSSRHDFSAFNASGIILSGDSMKQTEYTDGWPVHGGDLGADSNGKVGNHDSADPNSDHNKVRRLSTDPPGPHEYFQGQFRHPAFPQWPPPVYPPYPMQGMPYYQNYPGSGPYFQAPYPPTEDSRFNTPQRMGLKRHSMDSKDSIVDSEGALSTRSQDCADQNMSEFEKEDSQSRESHKKGSHSGKKKSGMVVIRNINYITSKRHEKSGSESSSASESETEEETEDSDVPRRKHKKSSRYSKKKGGQTKSSETSNVYEKDEVVHGHEADSGNWNVFQSFLLRSKEENTSEVDKDLFADEKEPRVKRRQNKNGADPILPFERDSGDVQERVVGFDSLNGNARRMKQVASNDELLISSDGRGSRGSQLDEQFNEIEGGRVYRRATNDDFMVYGREKQSGSKISLDPLAENEYEFAGRLDYCSSHNMVDDSIVVSLRSGPHDQLGTERRTAIDVDSELPTSLQRTDDSSSRVKNQFSYGPDELNMMPERELQRETISYDPAIDYDLQIPVVDAAKLESRNHDDTSTSTKEGLKKSDKKLKASQNESQKRRMDVLTRNGKSLRSNPLTEAQKRAEKLRSYKADLQKLKKEKEEEEIRRLDALKRERQKRIAARSSSNATQSPSTPKQTVARLPAKPSPNSYKGSKFSDSEPGSSSPLHKLPIRTTSIGSNDSQKNTKTSRLSGKTHSENGLTRSASSLPSLKKESNGLTPEARAAAIRRLSEPKGSNIHRASSVKPGGAQVSKKNMPDEPQMKISAIMHLDRTKSATLPELKIRPSKGTSDAGQKKSATKERVQKGSGSGATLTSESIKAKKTLEESSRTDNSEENPVVEKTVVTLENEMVPSTGVQASPEMIGATDRPYADNRMEKTEFISEYAAIRAPPSPINISELEGANEYKVDDQLNSYEVVMGYPKSESEKFSHSIAAETPYQAPYVRATSLEDPANSNLEYNEAPLTVTSETGAKVAVSGRAYVSNFVDSSSVEQVHEKSRTKESSKGLRKLLKFGRKGHNSASDEHSIDSEGLTVDDPSVAASSHDVHMLKNLISQDSQLGGTPPKASRTFSILSPFRSKTGDKKVAA